MHALADLAPLARQVYSRNLACYIYEFLVDFGNAVNSQVTQTTILEAIRRIEHLYDGPPEEPGEEPPEEPGEELSGARGINS